MFILDITDAARRYVRRTRRFRERVARSNIKRGRVMVDLSQFAGYTPGPWILDPDSLTIFHENGIAAIGEAYTGVWPDPSGRANAILITAAPELLEEVKNLRKALKYKENHMQELEEQLADCASGTWHPATDEPPQKEYFDVLEIEDWLGPLERAASAHLEDEFPPSREEVL